MLNATLWGGVRIGVESRGRRWPLLDRLFATAVIGFVLILLGMEALSLVGGIGVPGALGISGFALVVGLAFAWIERRGDGNRSQQRASGPTVVGVGSDASTALCATSADGPPAASSRFVGGLTLVVAAWAAAHYLLRGIALPVETVSDAPIYHLYFAIRWWKAGHLELAPTPFGELAATYFPANGDVWLCWLVVGSGGELPAKVGQWPFLLLGAASIYGLGRLVGAGWSAALFPAAIWMSVPAVLAFSPVANVDLIFTGFYLVAVYFLIRYWHERDPHALALMALACGVAIGTKAVGLVFAVPLVVTALAVGWRGGNPTRDVALVIAGLLLPCAYWFLRNLYWTGNPLYPLHTELFGRTVLEGWYDRAAMLVSGYHLSPTDWRAFLDRFTAVVDLRLAWLWPVALLGGLSFAGARSRPHAERRGVIALTVLAVVLMLVYWFVIPYNTQERFLLPALALGLAPLALLLQGRRWLQAAVLALLVWHLMTPLWQTQFRLNPSNRGAVLLPWDGGRLSGGVVVSGLALPLALGLAWAVLERTRRFRWIVCGFVVTAGGILAAWPAVRARGRTPELRFYPATYFAPNLLPAWLALEEARGPDGARVAYAGTNLPYYLFGRDLKNEVHYVNVNEHADWLLHDYHRSRRQAGDVELASDPWPAWYRDEPDYDAWLENLRDARIEYLFVARENQHGKRDVREGISEFPVERRWARDHPEVFEPVRLTFQSGAGDPSAELYRVKEAAP